MISILFSRIVILVCGTLYPGYKSFKAVRNKDAKEYMKWMMYWITFALFCVAESFADIFISFWFPFYYEIKIVFILWLVSPWTKGGTILYRKWIHPTLMKHEEEIDVVLQKVKAEVYNQAGSFGRRTLVYAREIVATAAVRGHGYLLSEETSRPIRTSQPTDDSIDSMSE
ncbi:Receptor expression-enhancing protein [Aphelenchoides besseyi]|nr:Receptor expression-enhancing protein [Aphelenchoides besseyi]KAI6200611.1 Receptor expression-enhancing protein [Aphelenchoides besseyi]